MQGEIPGVDLEKAVSIVQPLAQVGVTWWLESVWGLLKRKVGWGACEHVSNKGRRVVEHVCWLRETSVCKVGDVYRANIKL